MKTTACPTCYATSSSLEPLTNRPGKATCPKGHEFTDMVALMAMNPPMIDVASERAQVIPGDSTITIPVQSQIREMLQARFGAKLNATISAFLGVMCDPKAFVVSSVDIQQIKERSGKDVTNGKMLVGVISELGASLRESNERLEKMSSAPARAVSANSVEVPAFTSDEMKHLETVAAKQKVEGTNAVGRFIGAVIKQLIRKGGI